MGRGAKLYGRGIAFPPRIGPDGRLAYSDGPENVRESIRIILLTEPQERIMRPDFGGGLNRFLFQPNTPATHRLIEETITTSLGRWERRIALEGVDVGPDAEDPATARATLRYRLVATGLAEALSLAVPVGGTGGEV